MPCIKDIFSLHEILEDHIWKWLLKCLAFSKTSSDRTLLRNYVMNHLNANIRQKILDKALSVHFYTLDLSSKCSLLELLGDHSINCIDFTTENYSFVEEVFYLYRTLSITDLKNIVKFWIICRLTAATEVKYISEINSVFYLTLREMRYLRSVTMQGIGEPLLLQALGSSCPSLEYLDVSSSVLVNDASVFALLLKDPESVSKLPLHEISKYDGPINPCCSSLTFLGISGTDVNFISIVLSLHLLPNLNSYGGYIHQSSVCKAIKYMHDAEGVMSLKLVDLSDNFISEEQASLLLTVCPALTNVSSSAKSAPSLHNLHSITYLNLECDFQNYENCILDLLYVQGEALSCLVLKECLNSKIDLNYLSEYAPHLKEISLPLYCKEESTPIQLNELEKADISVNSIKCLKKLILSSPSLCHLSIVFDPEPYAETFESINDSLIISMLREGALKNLISLSIENCGIGDEGLEALLFHCLHLSFIEKLFYWKNLTKKFVKELNTRIISGNWNLKVVIKERYGDMSY